ncbi:conserved hypothetical protein [Beijerinckia indica subsp. indica ATCC 9039]|uniref:Uncharacterized protein n=1 Tax=Beijerinckia indica subsp. indica (strain ATCC 9039 / DSM 1715 / NCIMB 8712) TaxID=395963 RepID=B2IHU9_BEII9|nr:conserved hypothetical protein [Beijerinckia indica subsp. indica ATCC 9039]
MIAALAAYVFVLHALILAFVPAPSRADFDLASALQDICHHEGVPLQAPAAPDDACTLVNFFLSCCAGGHEGLAPPDISAGFTPRLSVAIAGFPPATVFFRVARTYSAAHPRGPPLKA